MKIRVSLYFIGNYVQVGIAFFYQEAGSSTIEFQGSNFESTCNSQVNLLFPLVNLLFEKALILQAIFCTCTFSLGECVIALLWPCILQSFASTESNLPYCFSEYMTYVMEALELEDIVKNYERRTLTGWFAYDYSLLFFFFESVSIHISGCLFMTLDISIISGSIFQALDLLKLAKQGPSLIQLVNLISTNWFVS